VERGWPTPADREIFKLLMKRLHLSRRDCDATAEQLPWLAFDARKSQQM